MELRVLKYFLAVAREGNMSKAAESIHVTQPTLSKQISDLEWELGTPLFLRNKQGKPLVLTEAGKILQKRGTDIAEMVSKTENDVRSLLNEEVSGEIFVGCAESKNMNYFADALVALQKFYPKIRCNLFSGDTSDIIGKLDSGLLDFAVIVQNVDLEKYNCISFPAKDRWGVIMKKESPLAKKEAVELNNLLDLPLICSRQSLREDLPKWFGETLNRMNIVATSNLPYNAGILAQKNVGYLLMFEGLVDTSEETPLCFRPLKPELTTDMHLIWRRGQEFTKCAELLLNEARKVFLRT